MKKFIKFITLTFVLCLLTSNVHAEWVNGYTTRNGRWVSGYNRSNRNYTVTDNYSYKGNVNPYTGTIGTNYYRNNSTSEYGKSRFKNITNKLYNY